jgi:hypothetical protein
MEQPTGFKNSNYPYVCKLQKSLYGLKQAPRAWLHRLFQAFLHLRSIGSLVDISLFILHHGSTHIFVLIYVDDIIITETDVSIIKSLIQGLQEEFKLKDLGNLSYFLGIHVLHDKSGLHLNQGKYIVDLLDRIHMLGAKPYTAPCTLGNKLIRLDGDPLPDPIAYRHIIGALHYCTLTRSDISYIVNQLCQFLHYPTTEHLKAAKRVLRYLKGTPEHGLHFKPGSLQLHAYCDSDWVGHPLDRRSTTSYCVFLGSNLVS